MQTSKGTINALAREGPHGARTSVGCPRLDGKPRDPSLVIGPRDEQQHRVGKRLRKKGIKCNFDD